VTPARRRREPAGRRIPAELAGPVEVALARSVDQIPAPNALLGGSRYEVKWDGYLH
jgi:ATP-dependent DNA ligase